MINQAHCVRQPITQFITRSTFNLVKIRLPILLLLVSLEQTNYKLAGGALAHDLRGNVDVDQETGYKKIGPFSTRPRQTKPPNKNYAKSIYIWILPNGPSAYKDTFRDDMWKDQWYQHDYRQVDGPVLDHNIVPVQRMGYNGMGISVGVLGERLAHGHPDLFGRVSEIFDTVTGKSESNENKNPVLVENLATNVAGVVAMRANNSLCGAGIAYNAKLVGITVPSDIDGKTHEDAVVEAMQHKLIDTHIYVDAIKRIHDGKGLPYSKAIKIGLKSIARKGRNNKGAIYVMGSGDGRANGDHCGADFVANSIYTFVIGSATSSGILAEFSERCAAVIAAAYSTKEIRTANGLSNVGVVTTKGGEDCTREFSGTAASAAIASGIFALVLQAKPDLEWRDLMHIVAISSEIAPVRRVEDRMRNDAGFWVSSHVGFGLLNAENMVLASRRWRPVPKMVTCKVQFKNFGSLNSGYGYEHTNDVLKVDECLSVDDSGDRVKYIEQVELVTTISFRDRSTVEIFLTSPAGTRSTLYESRKNDKSVQGFNNWKIRSFHFWGEMPSGNWTLSVIAQHDHYSDDKVGCIKYSALRLSELVLKLSSFGYIGDQIRKAELVIHGTSELPYHYQEMDSHRRRTYAYYG